MVTTTNFEDWFSQNCPQTDMEFLSLYRAVQYGDNNEKYTVTVEDDCKYISSESSNLVLRLASSKAVYIFIKMLGQRAKVDDFEQWCNDTPKIFKASASAEEILQEVINYGLAGISGGRVAVRRLKSQVQVLADDNGLEDICSFATYNHPYTELAYPYDLNQYSQELAKRLVIRTYDDLNKGAY
ncbi:hypothetical protein [Vibrio diazotrophicus]|uniref:Uncharacterized protein n=1 Tax=Vibrio diazotrophicus TaxID=685 RepID=A0ABX4WBT2_VIBDI|nr:hypothetical protein [Vibrio diazotrophicus]PNI01495.1 hypothetical protein C1O25_08175 [Vibrio diazotrophicus]